MSESITWDGFQFDVLQRCNGFEIQHSYKPSFQGNPIKVSFTSRPSGSDFIVAVQFLKCNYLGVRPLPRTEWGE